ncbi:MAG: DinB family protein [Acidimicrobiia bacterium]|jgi:hypothetical protein
MDEIRAKAELHRYLKMAWDSLLWKTEGLSEYNVRRPLTPTGTNLLGLLKHVASVSVGYLGDCFGRPFPETPSWFDDDAEVNADMWVPADESRQFIFDFWDRAWAHANATIDALPLGAEGVVPWWPEDRNPVTLHQILLHVATEVNRHAGHADILRELIDGSVGHRPAVSNMPDDDAIDWPAYFDRVEHAARTAQRA